DRDADEVDAVEIERREEVEIEIGEVVDGVEPVGRVRLPEARMLRRDHVELFRERRHERQPRGATSSMEDDERWPGAAAHQADCAAADREPRGGWGGHHCGLADDALLDAIAISCNARAKLGPYASGSRHSRKSPIRRARSLTAHAASVVMIA